MTSIVEQVINLVKNNEKLSEEIMSLREKSVSVDKFYNVALTTNMVAELHSVTPALVRKYVKLGMIDEHPKSTDSKILIRASDALRLDFKKLKKHITN